MDQSRPALQRGDLVERMNGTIARGTVSTAAHALRIRGLSRGFDLDRNRKKMLPCYQWLWPNHTASQLIQGVAMRALKIRAIGFGLAACILAGASASAAVYDWTFDDNSGDLVASGILITGGPITVSIPGAGSETIHPVLSARGSLLSVDGFTAEKISQYGTYTTPVGYNSVAGQTYDNAIFGNVPYVDGNGLEFRGNTSGQFFNIYNNVNTGYYSAGNYPNNDVFWNSSGQSAAGTFSVSSVPEPATWAMMLLGFICIGVGYRRTKGVTTTVVTA
ncbi:PEPxxWA-CTERM sorting domain-containing protein [Rhodoblastus sp.]|uniref:PEPxxWA-CTERM sorting domain-containing protein n=1 Tax=Rhodoblastus sp. TaxID=1962975 RepID=UPI003F9629D6